MNPTLIAKLTAARNDLQTLTGTVWLPNATHEILRRAEYAITDALAELQPPPRASGPSMRPIPEAAVAKAIRFNQPDPQPGSYSSADLNGPATIPAAGAAPGGVEPEDDPWDNQTPADKGGGQ
jgi:hypothetical protein